MGPVAIESRGSALPAAAGPLSELVLECLDGPAPAAGDPPEPHGHQDLSPLTAGIEDPAADDDLQLALYLCYELHYRSFAGVDERWEWSPYLLGLRAALEAVFLASVRERLPAREPVPPERVPELLFELEAADDGPSLSRYMAFDADLEQFREFVAHRSAYQLKEADPHSWAIPRLVGPPKSALVEVQGDEYGGGRPERMHSALFAKTMRALDLDDREGAYLSHLPGITLATVNLMSACGLRRDLRGAIVGHLAMFEITSSRPNRLYADGLRRLGLGEPATDFYDEHVEADAVHENIAAHELAGGLARREPALAGDILLGARSLLLLDRLFAEHLLGAWRAGASSLRSPLLDPQR